MDTDLSLFEAIESGQIEKAKEIIDKNPDLIQQLHPTRSHRRTQIRAIHRAVHHGRTEIVEAILHRAIDQPNYWDEPIREFFHNYKVPTALSLAKDQGHKDILSVIDTYFASFLKTQSSIAH